MGDRAFVEYLLSFEDIEEPGIRIIRWNDSKIFNFAHTKGSGYPTTIKERWHRDKNNKCRKTLVDMPSVIGKYNKCMGGIDKMDSMIEKVLLRIISNKDTSFGSGSRFT